MLVHLRRSLVLAIICLVFFGFIYAFAGAGVSQLLFKNQADGSLTANGSTLIGQPWNLTKCPGHPRGSCVFQGRPDDLGPYSDAEKSNPSPVGHPGDDPLVLNGVAGGSGATNLGPHSKELVKYTKILVRYWHARGVNPTPDLVTTSGSGYDPDISQQDAIVQIPMVSKATGISAPALRKLIADYTHPAQWGFLGAQYIDVLQLNEGLATLKK
ncbi:MAG TPA: potassium-transporting ATPase subunit C [Acidimicrobiales bacterium]|jgi:K+-transporting ATPase ATPase C chain|nr:potassium-transporting ATPase subunit C [Acidimicrobiales bacterium]